MEDNNNNKNRKVTARDLLVAAVIVIGLIIVGWHKENGKLWAILIFALIPIVALFNNRKIPIEKRIEAENEFNKTKFAKVLNFIRIGSLITLLSVILFFLISWWLHT